MVLCVSVQTIHFKGMKGGVEGLNLEVTQLFLEEDMLTAEPVLFRVLSSPEGLVSNFSRCSFMFFLIIFTNNYPGRFVMAAGITIALLNFVRQLFST